MNFLSDKTKIIRLLFAIAIVVLLANIILDKLYPTTSVENIALNIEEIETRFRVATTNLGMNEEWMTKKKGSVDPVILQVKVPRDLPVSLILQEMNNVFNPGEVSFHSVEKTIGGKTTFNISSGDEIKLVAEFIYDNKIRRKTVRVGFLITGLSENEETDSLLLNYPESFASVLIPSKATYEFVKKTGKFNKEYIVYLNDGINDLDFKLSDKYSNLRLRNSIRSIVGAFSKAFFFLVDDKSDLYSSSIFPFVKEEIEKRKIRMVEYSVFKEIKSSAEKDLSAQFREEMEKLSGGEDALFIISASDFLSLRNEITEYRKRGYKFTNPSALSF